MEIGLGAESKDVYDAVSQDFLLRNVSGKVQINLPSDSARVVVLAPAKGKLTHEGTRTLIDGVIVDYRH